MSELSKTALLLNHVGVMRHRWQQNRPTDYRFNIFGLLRPAHDEVHLHSRFLFELLNPKGSHGMGDVFLRSFAHECGFTAHACPAELNFGNIQVHREHGNVDLLIDDGIHAVIIENKIYAADQPQQLQRYYDANGQKRKPTLYYLTLDGHDPSEVSLGTLPLDKVQNISYAQEIDAWLTTCIQQAALLPGLRETLIQYQKLIQKLTGKAMAETKEQLVALLEKGENGLDAGLIVNNWNHVRHHVELQFWNELAALVGKKYKVSADARFDAARISRAINNSRNRDTGYGIRATIGTLDGVPLQFKINRGDGTICYGIPRPKNDILNLAPKLEMLRNAFELKEASNFWLISKLSKININFSGFSTQETLALINPAKRSESVEMLWTEVESLVDAAISALEATFPDGFVKERPSEVL